jgi:predicted glycosyltransferase involved in capsule biosynthesis
VKRNDNILEEDYVLVSQWHSETTNDRSKDIQKFSSSVELVGLMNQSEETLVDCLSDHLSSWHKLGVKLMQDVFKVVSLYGLL